MVEGIIVKILISLFMSIGVWALFRNNFNDTIENNFRFEYSKPDMSIFNSSQKIELNRI